jgi:hypothetical protein
MQGAKDSGEEAVNETTNSKAADLERLEERHVVGSPCV